MSTLQERYEKLQSAKRKQTEESRVGRQPSIGVARPLITRNNNAVPLQRATGKQPQPLGAVPTTLPGNPPANKHLRPQLGRKQLAPARISSSVLDMVKASGKPVVEVQRSVLINPPIRDIPPGGGVSPVAADAVVPPLPDPNVAAQPLLSLDDTAAAPTNAEMEEMLRKYEEQAERNDAADAADADAVVVSEPLNLSN